MAFTEAQVKNLEAKLDASTSERGVFKTPPSPMSKAGMSSQKPTASLATTLGIGARFRRAASGPGRIANGTSRPTRQRFGFPSGPAQSRSRVKAVEAAKPRASQPGEAHELALKAAETDATKRALATFGNPFGLALYDRDLAGVTQSQGP